jgi:hypothetical protein
MIPLDLFGFGQMSSDVMLGLKIVALVMLYGYMHMNLGGGILSTSVFIIFGYYFVFYAHGMLSILILVLFFLMIHGFDILWGGDIVRGNVTERLQLRQQMREPMVSPYRVRVPP